MTEEIYGTRSGPAWDWGMERIGVKFDPHQAVAIVLERAGVVRAVTFFDRCTENDCCMHIASDQTGKWLTRQYLYECFAYPFLQRKQTRVTGLVPSKNESALRFDQRLGFKREGVLRCGTLNDDLVVLGMLAQECRFIRPDFVRRFKPDGKRL